MMENGTTLNPTGSMAKGWIKDSGSWYYFKSDGSMATGWIKDDGNFYYLGSSGAMLSNQWFETNGKWYYVNGSGILAINTTVDGYTVNEKGEWIP